MDKIIGINEQTVALDYVAAHKEEKKICNSILLLPDDTGTSKYIRLTIFDLLFYCLCCALSAFCQI